MEQCELLWVSTNPASRHPSKSRPEERFAINSHIQRYRKRNEQSSKHRKLLNDSAAKSVVGWTTRSTSLTPSPTATHVSVSSESSDARPTPKLVDVTHHVDNQMQLIRSICGKDEAVDPFDSVATKLDFDATERLKFYLHWGRPIAWQRQSYGAIGSVMDIQVVRTIEKCMSDELRGLTLLSYVAALMEYLQLGQNFKQDGTSYHQRALRSLRATIQKEPSTTSTLLYDICLLCRAARCRNDEFGALTHLRAIRQIVDEAGGLEKLDAMVTKYVLFTDRRLAYARLTPPSYSLRQQMGVLREPGSVASDLPTFIQNGKSSNSPPDYWKANSSLEELGNDLADKLDKSFVPKSLRELYKDIIMCAQVLESISARVASAANASWLTARHLAISTELLTLSFSSEKDTGIRHKLESIRASLFLWDHLIMASMAKGRARNVLQTIAPVTLERNKAAWPTRVYSGYQDWNRAVRTSPLKLAVNDSGLFLRLLGVVSEMEADNEVRLGSFMLKLCKLEQIHYQDQEVWATLTPPQGTQHPRSAPKTMPGYFYYAPALSDVEKSMLGKG